MTYAEACTHLAPILEENALMETRISLEGIDAAYAIYRDGVVVIHGELTATDLEALAVWLRHQPREAQR